MRAASLLSLFAAAAVLASPVPVKNETETLAKRDSYNERWNIVDVNLDAIGVTKFRGWQNNAVASWFDTNSERDSTNGESWCWTHYHVSFRAVTTLRKTVTDSFCRLFCLCHLPQNDLPGIAISYNAMMSDGNWSNEEAGRKYCGLEVVIKTKDGRQLTAVIADGKPE